MLLHTIDARVFMLNHMGHEVNSLSLYFLCNKWDKLNIIYMHPSLTLKNIGNSTYNITMTINEIIYVKHFSQDPICKYIYFYHFILSSEAHGILLLFRMSEASTAFPCLR